MVSGLHARSSGLLRVRRHPFGKATAATFPHREFRARRTRILEGGVVPKDTTLQFLRRFPSFRWKPARHQRQQKVSVQPPIDKPALGFSMQIRRSVRMLLRSSVRFLRSCGNPLEDRRHQLTTAAFVGRAPTGVLTSWKRKFGQCSETFLKSFECDFSPI